MQRTREGKKMIFLQTQNRFEQAGADNELCKFTWIGGEFWKSIRKEKRGNSISWKNSCLVKERNSWIARDLSSWLVLCSILEISNQLDKLPDINSSFSPRDAII